MIYVDNILLTIYFATIFVTVITVLMDNRQPAKTVAWIMVLLFLPIIGFILYICFGQNIRKQHLISQRSLDKLTKRNMLEFAEQKNLSVPEECRSLVRLFANQSMALPFKDNHADIYTSGYDWILSLLREIGRAENHVHIDTYIIEDDPLGMLVADALIDKAKQGVEVRLIYDDVGCWNVKNKFFQRMINAGVEVRPFLPVKFPLLTGRVNYRNHRKLIVIDGEVGFIGGMNIALRYVKGNPCQPWRDTHLKVTGGIMYAMQRAFLIDWYFTSRILITDHSYYPDSNMADENDCIAQIVTSSPAQPWPNIMQGYVKILLEAKKYVYMETPYFLPTEEILFAMRTAALSGTDVRLMVPVKGDAKLVEWASRTYVSAVTEAGIKIYLYKPGFNHSKILIADDYVCSCGSANVDFRSFENNFESNIIFYDHDMAMRLKEVWNDDAAKCVSIEDVKQFNHRAWLQRLFESIVRIMAPLL